MTTKVHYDLQTGSVIGYYPDNLPYKIIPEPFIEVADEELKASLGKLMHVVNDTLVEATLSEAELLSSTKLAKISQLVAIRKILQCSNMNYLGWDFIGSEKARSNLSRAWQVLVAEGITSQNWLTADNVTVLLTTSDIQTLNKLFLDRGSKLYFQEAVIISKIEACKTVEDVNAVVLSFSL